MMNPDAIKHRSKLLPCRAGGATSPLPKVRLVALGVCIVPLHPEAAPVCFAGRGIDRLGIRLPCTRRATLLAAASQKHSQQPPVFVEAAHHNTPTATRQHHVQKKHGPRHNTRIPSVCLCLSRYGECTPQLHGRGVGEECCQPPPADTQRGRHVSRRDIVCNNTEALHPLRHRLGTGRAGAA
jgi:hypothetical protein